MLTALGLPADPREHLAELADVLDGTYRQVGAGLAGDDAARICEGKLSLARLEPAPPPEGFATVRDAVTAMLPRIDYLELILLVGRSCNIGLLPVTQSGTAAWRLVNRGPLHRRHSDPRFLPPGRLPATRPRTSRWRRHRGCGEPGNEAIDLTPYDAGKATRPPADNRSATPLTKNPQPAAGCPVRAKAT